jgi:hypothetical protein
MTTHQLAGLLEHLQLGFGDNLKTATGMAFAEAVVAFREFPDQPLKEFVKSVRKANGPQPPVSRAARPAPVDVAAEIERIRSHRTGAAPGPAVVDPSRLTAGQLKDILRAFQQPLTGTKAALAVRVQQLTAFNDQVNGTHPPLTPPDQPDPFAVEEAVRIYSELRDSRSLTIADVRAGFERLRGYPKPVIEELARRLQFTPHGTRTEMLDRLLSNLEGIKMSQHKMDQILTGT